MSGKGLFHKLSGRFSLPTDLAIGPSIGYVQPDNRSKITHPVSRYRAGPASALHS
jgi:hypothetical protein